MRILFASMPFDGHFNPLTGIAAYLQGKGHDVRFYTGPTFGKKLSELGIPHVPFSRAKDVNAENLIQYFPEYERLGTGPKAIAFALEKVFFGNLEAHFHDIRELHATFPFDAMINDGAFYAAHLVARKLQENVYAIGPAPTPAPRGRNTPPPFFGLRPATTIFGRIKHRIVSAMVDSANKGGMQMLDDVLSREGLPPYVGHIFDLPCSTSKMVFQSGCPGMDFPRDDFPKNYRFVGPLLPAKTSRANERGLAYKKKLEHYDSLVVVSQGTVDNRDPEKLIVPVIEALAGTKHLVVATTGNRNTEALRRRFPQDNVVVEDFVDFDLLLEDADLFVCNGGYGSIMLSLVKGVPILSAGKLEGKNDINARLDYRGLGVDLNTERPTPRQIKDGVARVLGDPRIKGNVVRVQEELASYRPFEIIEQTLVSSA